MNDDFKHYYPKDYVYGEYIPMVETYQKLKKKAKNSQKPVENLPNKSQYVRTKNLKLVYHDNKKSELYEIKNNQEKKIENSDLREDLEVLLKVKEKRIKGTKDRFKINIWKSLKIKILIISNA